MVFFQFNGLLAQTSAVKEPAVVETQPAARSVMSTEVNLNYDLLPLDLADNVIDGWYGLYNRF